jgi:ribosomal-protein-alanine N-acetyltransferase
MRVEAVTAEGRNLRIEPLTEAHAADLFSLADPGIFTFIQQMAPEEWTESGFRTYLTWLANRPDQEYEAMVLTENGRAVGVSSFMDIRPGHRALEIGGTWIVRRYQGTFVNPECKYLMLRQAFEGWGAVRVQLKTDVRNMQSRRNIEKLGAKREGIMRKHMILPDGYQRDTILYSITDDEWPQVRTRLEERLGYVP